MQGVRGYTGLMRIMALDIGEKRVGIAVSDPGERVASPVCVLSADEVREVEGALDVEALCAKAIENREFIRIKP